MTPKVEQKHTYVYTLLAINRHPSQLISREKSESQALNIDSSICQASSILLIITDLLSPLVVAEHSVEPGLCNL